MAKAPAFTEPRTGFTAWLVPCVATLACAPTSAGSDQLRARSAFELNCPGETLQIQQLDTRTMGVTGCGHRATYAESCNAPTSYKAAECTWIMTSDRREPPSAPIYAAAGSRFPPPSTGTIPPAQPGVQPASAQPAYVVQPMPGPASLAYGETPVQLRPAELEYQRGTPIPPGYRLEEYHSPGLIIGGLAGFGALYVMSFAAAVDQKFSSGYGWLALPVFGPFGWLAARKAPTCTLDTYSNSSSMQSCQDDEDNKKAMVLLDGVGQAAGAALLITGLAVTRRHLVLIGGQEVMFVPHVSSDSGGLNVFGRF